MQICHVIAQEIKGTNTVWLKKKTKQKTLSNEVMSLLSEGSCEDVIEVYRFAILLSVLDTMI